MKTAIFTIASKNYLPYVKTLMESVGKIHPEYERYLFLADEVDGYFPEDQLPCNLIKSCDINIPNFHDMTLRYDIMEFNTAIKPFAFKWLFENTDFDAVYYLDPDLWIVSPFALLENALKNGASVVLTPHITQPIEDDKSPNDHHMLMAGVFNLGFIAIRRCEESINFLNWWAKKLQTQCISDLPNNLFVDQKWCDLAPCFLSNLHILRDPGYNVAYWNLVQRAVSKDLDGRWMVNDAPLVFFHFSGVSVDSKNCVSKHQNRLFWEDVFSCQELFQMYLKKLSENGWDEAKSWPYHYSESGLEGFYITPIMRHVYRMANPEPIDIGTKSLKDHFIRIFNLTSQVTSDASCHKLSRVMTLIYGLRPDLQKTFDLNAPHDREAFINWFYRHGIYEYKISEFVQMQADQFQLKKSQNVNGVIGHILLLCALRMKKIGRVLIRFLPESLRPALRRVMDKFYSSIYRLF